jgi:hypothetical protein
VLAVTGPSGPLGPLGVVGDQGTPGGSGVVTLDATQSLAIYRAGCSPNLQGNLGISNIAIGHCSQINPSLISIVRNSDLNKTIGCCNLNNTGARNSNVILGSNCICYTTALSRDVCNNVLIGHQLQPGSSAGSKSILNVAVGYCLLGGEHTESVAIGYTALKNRNPGQGSTVIGQAALGGSGFSNSDNLFDNLVIGNHASYSFRNHCALHAPERSTPMTGPYNISIGRCAMRSATCGNSNTSIGLNSQYFAVYPRDNVAMGNYSSYCNVTGWCNTAVGQSSIRCALGDDNTALGYNAGCNLVLGNNNTFIGPCSFAITSTMNNTVILGSNSMTTFRSNGVISSTSDSRDKQDVELIPTGFQFLNDIRPVKFTWNMRNQGKVNIKDSGFIAQQLLDTVVKHDVRTWLSVVLDIYPETLMVTPSKLIPVIVRAIQEVSTKRSSDIAKLKLEIAELKKRLQ